MLRLLSLSGLLTPVSLHFLDGRMTPPILDPDLAVNPIPIITDIVVVVVIGVDTQSCQIAL